MCAWYIYYRPLPRYNTSLEMITKTLNNNYYYDDNKNNNNMWPRDPKSRGGAPHGQVPPSPPPPMMMPRRRLFLSRRSPFLRDGYNNSHTVVNRVRTIVVLYICVFRKNTVLLRGWCTPNNEYNNINTIISALVRRILLRWDKEK